MNFADLKRGLLVAPPKVTVQCHCGSKLLIPYGSRQACECGRTWNTAQIPAADYAALRATVRRFRRNEVAFVMVALGLVAVLSIVARRAPVLIAAPVFLLVWLRWFRPWWAVRRRARLTELPTWQMRPETGPNRSG